MVAVFRAALFGLAFVALSTTANADPRLWRQLSISGNLVRWHNPLDANGRLLLTWRITDAPQAFSDAVNCRRMTPPDALLAASRISQVEFRRELSAAFAMWESVAGISFLEAPPHAEADITIGAQGDPTGRAYADVAFHESGPGRERAIKRALVCLNPEVRWKTGFDGDLEVYDLRYTLAHEIGHAIGLDHPEAPGSLMWFKYAEKSRHLQPGDVDGAVALYGPARSFLEHAAVAKQRD